MLASCNSIFDGMNAAGENHAADGRQQRADVDSLCRRGEENRACGGTDEGLHDVVERVRSG